jgi:Co/Zn/Cd efflux system component
MNSDNVFLMVIGATIVSILLIIAALSIYEKQLEHECRMDPICQMSMRCGI